MAPLILDGRALAAARLPAIRDRARAMAGIRGRPPGLLILAFEGPDGRAPWLDGKLRAARDAGIDVRTLVLPHAIGTAAARDAFASAVADAETDGVFVQFPFPSGVDGDVLSAAIPGRADIDVMHPARVRAYLAGAGPTPPLTVSAILLLLGAHGLTLTDAPTVVVAEGTVFDRMLVEAVRRRGARVRMVSPDAPDAAHRLAEARVVITSVGRPGAVAGERIAPGAVVVDGGYFNPGGRGDVDLSGGAHHLRALCPVPGGVGPMTVSALLEAVVVRAEETLGHSEHPGESGSPEG